MPPFTLALPASPSSRRIHRGTATLMVAATALFGACGGKADRPTLADTPSTTPAEQATTAPTSSTPSAASTTNPPAPDATTRSLDATGIVVRATGDVELWDAPDGNVIATLPPTTSFGSPTTLAGVEWAGHDHRWLQVLLPTRPNGSTAFVRADQVQLGKTSLRITVDRAANRLVVHDGTAALVDTSIAIGAPSTPTPAGSFFVTDVVDNPDDAGAYGPFALGLSAHSDVLDQFGGGDGQIGIHGTDQPNSIGQAASHGCVRVPNEVVVRLAELIPLGTPVTIV